MYLIQEQSYYFSFLLWNRFSDSGMGGATSTNRPPWCSSCEWCDARDRSSYDEETRLNKIRFFKWTKVRRICFVPSIFCLGSCFVLKSTERYTIVKWSTEKCGFKTNCLKKWLLRLRHCLGHRVQMVINLYKELHRPDMWQLRLFIKEHILR